jgi:hypothetical protein
MLALLPRRLAWEQQLAELADEKIVLNAPV